MCVEAAADVLLGTHLNIDDLGMYRDLLLKLMMMTSARQHWCSCVATSGFPVVSVVAVAEDTALWCVCDRGHVPATDDRVLLQQRSRGLLQAVQLQVMAKLQGGAVERLEQQRACINGGELQVRADGDKAEAVVTSGQWSQLWRGIHSSRRHRHSVLCLRSHQLQQPWTACTSILGTRVSDQAIALHNGAC